MKTIKELLSILKGSTTLNADQRRTIAQTLSEAAKYSVYEPSVSFVDGKLLALGRCGRVKKLIVADEQGRLVMEDTGPASAEVVRKRLKWTVPQVCGLATSVGLGDRLGLATPGHLQAVKGSGCVPFLAQQSIREMTRTHRTPAEVMDDAMWGVLQAGWRKGFGSDADHLKTPDDIDVCLTVGFTMYTFDPGDHVRSDADAMEASRLSSAMKSLAWSELETTPVNFRQMYLDKSFALDGGDSISFDDETLARAAIKYGGAITHTVKMYRHLAEKSGSRPFEVEVSVDETATPTTVAEHYLISAELKRLGVRWVSLAPRFIGAFEKGVDYKGDLSAFSESFAAHAAVARTLGPYKLSLHSGSDKFSVYSITAELTDGLVHLKTAGTSYLEALRVIARKAPELFRRILDFAFTRFDEDKATYHISARVEVIPKSGDLSDEQLETVLDGNDGRQLLHVTYGSVLTDKTEDGSYRFRNELMNVLMDNEEEHYAILSRHLGRHVQPFAR